MDVIYSLIPGMTFFGLIFVGILIWAVKHGQYEDMEGNASRILLDDDEDAMLRDDVVPGAKKEGDVFAPKK
jgi:cbb3-type cytochrome oxidase maturation protein